MSSEDSTSYPRSRTMHPSGSSTSTDQEGVVYDGVSRASQEAALAFIAEQAFETPSWLNEPEVLSLIGLNGFTNVSARQAGMLGTLLDVRRLGRLAELEVLDPADAYPLAAYLDDLRQAVFGPISVTVADPYRRSLQRAWVEEMEELMTAEPTLNVFLGPGPDLVRSDIRPLVRAQLEAVRREVEAAAGRVQGVVLRAHLRDLVERIEVVLEPRQAP